MPIYIAGPMTGHPDMNYPAFHQAERMLRDAGYDTRSPAIPIVDGWGWADYMRDALKQLLQCDQVALLDGWEASRGATLEHHVATQLEMPIYPLAVWLQRVGAS